MSFQSDQTLHTDETVLTNELDLSDLSNLTDLSSQWNVSGQSHHSGQLDQDPPSIGVAALTATFKPVFSQRKHSRMGSSLSSLSDIMSPVHTVNAADSSKQFKVAVGPGGAFKSFSAPPRFDQSSVFGRDTSKLTLSAPQLGPADRGLAAAVVQHDTSSSPVANKNLSREFAAL